MARETALWQRCKTGMKELRRQGHTVDLQRIENAASSGHPDIEGCIDGGQVWIEMKSCERPVRTTTPIRPKCRVSQEIWHRVRTEAGSLIHWMLIQVGEGSEARLYLIPGREYYEVKAATESKLAALSAVAPTASIANVLLRAVEGW